MEISFVPGLTTASASADCRASQTAMVKMFAGGLSRNSRTQPLPAASERTRGVSLMRGLPTIHPAAGECG